MDIGKFHSVQNIQNHIRKIHNWQKNINQSKNTFKSILEKKINGIQEYKNFLKNEIIYQKKSKNIPNSSNSNFPKVAPKNSLDSSLIQAITQSGSLAGTQAGSLLGSQIGSSTGFQSGSNKNSEPVTTKEILKLVSALPTENFSPPTQ
jgi:hypothetical protein